MTRALQLTGVLYYQQDDVVTIHIWKETDPSPNSARAASHSESLRDRRKDSGTKRTGFNVLLRSALLATSKSLDVASLEPISDLAESEKVELNLSGGQTETYSNDYLMGKLTFLTR